MDLIFIAQSHQKGFVFNRTTKAIFDLVSSFLQPFSLMENQLFSSFHEFYEEITDSHWMVVVRRILQAIIYSSNSGLEIYCASLSHTIVIHQKLK